MNGLNMLRPLLLSIALFFTFEPAAAHEIRPTIADVEVSATEVTLSLRITIEALVSGVDLSSVDNTNDAPEAIIYDRLRAMNPADLEAAFRDAWDRISRGFLIEVEGNRLTPGIVSVTIPPVGEIELPRDSLLVIGVTLPEGNAGVRVGLDASFGQFVPRQVGGGENSYEGFLEGGQLTPELPRGETLNESGLQVFARYVIVGFQHIIPLGLDHILFVLGLFFFAAKLGPLLWQVTAFTLAHTVTLAVAATGIVTVPTSIVEPIIAATIVYVGLENTFGWGTMRGRTILVFLFGLVHGLGFASVLGDFGIASGAFVEALLGFNLGVEFGQLAVIAIAFALVGWFMSKPWYRTAIAIPASLIISAIGAFWVVERTLL